MRERSGPCPHDGSCLDWDCPHSHEERRMECPKAAGCRDALCSLLHPVDAVDTQVACEAQLEARGVAEVLQKVRLARWAHLAAFAKAVDEARLANSAAESGSGTATQGHLFEFRGVEYPKSLEYLKAKEMREQLDSFDSACWRVVRRLRQLRPEMSDRDAPLRSGLRGDDGIFAHGAARAASGPGPPHVPLVEQKNALERRLLREIARLKAALPALAKREVLHKLLQEGRRCLVIRGATGSGKSTQLPQYLAEDFCGCGSDGRPLRVVCTQPRKPAATSLAERVKEEWAADNFQVGFHVGGACTVQKSTVISYVTEEILLQQLLHGGAGALAEIGAVVLDEAHERTMRFDILLGRLRDIQESERNDLCIVVTSATLDMDLFAKYLRDCPKVEIEGRMFPVEDYFEPLPDAANVNYVDAVVQKAFQVYTDSGVGDGDLLCFLQGQREVETAKDSLQRKLGEGTAEVMVLHGGQDYNDQKKAFEPAGRGKRKVIFATNIAETSITIDGVRFVVDSGIEKAMVYDAKRNLNSLEEVRISKSSAQQRRGRAGRTASGCCYRLYSFADFESMQETQLAEVQSRPAHLTLLTLLSMGLDPVTFPWLEPPDALAVERAWQTLAFLGATTSCKHRPVGLTDFGHLAAALQIEPAMAKVLSVGGEQGLTRQAADVVAVMSVFKDFFKRVPDGEGQQSASQRCRPDGDIATMYRLYRQWVGIRSNASGNNEAREFCSQEGLVPKALITAKKIGDDLTRQIEDFSRRRRTERPGGLDAGVPSRELTDPELSHLVLAGCYMNIGVIIGGQGTCRTALYQVAREGPASQAQQEATTAAAIFPGSPFLKTRANEEAPAHVCFVNMAETSRLFLHGIMPLPGGEAAWLPRVAALSPSFAAQLREALPHISSSRVKVHGYATAFVSGAQAKLNKKAIETEFLCTVMYDARERAVVAWCRPQVEVPLRARLERLRDTQKESARQEVEEELLAGETRVVFGLGGEVVTVLYAGECLSVHIHGLGEGATEEDLARQMAKYGRVRRAWLQPASLPCSARRFGQVTFWGKEGAQLALERFPRDYRDGLVAVHPGGVVPAASAQDVGGHLRLSWDISDLGRAETTEEPLQIVVAMLRSLVPLPEREPELVTFHSGSDRNVSTKMAGLKATYPGGGVEVLQAAMEAWQRPGARWAEDAGVTPRMLDSLACKCIYQVAFRLPTELFQHFLPPCDRGAACLWSDCKLSHPKRQRDCKFGLRCGRAKSGLGACEYSHPRSWYDPGFVASPATANPLRDAMELCKRRGVKLNTATHAARTSLFLEHDHLQHLVECKDSLASSLSGEVFLHIHKDLLFQPPGLRALQQVQRSCTAYLQWDRATRTVRVFGEPQGRKQAMVALGAEIEALKQLKHATFSLWGKTGSHLRARRAELDRFAQELGIRGSNVELRGCMLHIWATDEVAAEASRIVERRGWLNARPVTTSAAGELCCLCMCEFDGERYQLQSCGHTFCLECIKNAVSDPDGQHFPIKCPHPTGDAGMCSQALVWKDIAALCSSQVLARIKHIAIDTYVRENQGLAMYCVKAGCNHILRPPRPPARSRSQKEQRQRGGEAGFCEQCCTSYCFTCSDACREPKPLHFGSTCEEAQHEDSPDVKRHRRHIVEELLTLRCPRCKRAFMDYSACAAIKCDNCDCGFCGKCFMDCGSDAHSHVTNCRGPGIPGIEPVQTGYYLSESQFQGLNLQVAEYRIKMYLDSLGPALRQEVVHACRNDFAGRPGGNLSFAA